MSLLDSKSAALKNQRVSERDIARTTGSSYVQVLRGYCEERTIFENCAAKVLDL